MLKAVQEVVQTLTGHELVHQGNSVAYRQVSGVETLQWLLTKKGWSGHWNCHCTGAVASGESSGAPFLSTNSVETQMEQCWSRCGCWTAPYATGGQSAMTTYCGRCCGQGGQGGSGMVRITYV